MFVEKVLPFQFLASADRMPRLLVEMKLVEGEPSCVSKAFVCEGTNAFDSHDGLLCEEVPLLDILVVKFAGSAPLEVDYTYVPASPKACAPECSFHGTCDADLGQCQCPAGRGGLDCSQTLTPSCHLAGALANHMVSGCPFDLEGGGGQAVSCACLRECWGIGIDLVCVSDIVREGARIELFLHRNMELLIHDA